MPIDEQTALQMLTKLAVEARLTQKIANIMYRPDAQDYVVLLDDDAVCLIREKLITLFHEQKLADAKREIIGRLKTAEKVDINAPPEEPEEKISVEDDL